jgi:hypothetical protein
MNRAACTISLVLLAFVAAAADCPPTFVKYRDTPVCLQEFQYQDTRKSSFVRGAWYDADNDYLVISLKGTRYHYCRMPVGVWNAFRAARSFGRFYLRSIKGKFDCRLGGVPAYRP